MTDHQQSGVEMIAFVAERMGSFRKRVVFVGGTVTGLLVTDPAARSIRSTDDVDVIVEVATYPKYVQVGEELRRLGFSERTRPGDPICRWCIEGMVVDVMPTEEKILGFHNRWYSVAIQTATDRLLRPDLSIRLITAPYFIATKIEAFRGRGRGDYLVSKDIEDIISVVDGRAELLAEVTAAPQDLKSFLASAFQTLLKDYDFIDALQAQLYPDSASQGRLPEIEKRMADIAALEAV